MDTCGSQTLASPVTFLRRSHTQACESPWCRAGLASVPRSSHQLRFQYTMMQSRVGMSSVTGVGVERRTVCAQSVTIHGDGTDPG
jgi:hypothetical protein